MWIRAGKNQDDSCGYRWTDEPVDVSEVIAFAMADLAERQARHIEEVLGPLYEQKKEKTAASFHSDAAAG